MLSSIKKKCDCFDPCLNNTFSNSTCENVIPSLVEKCFGAAKAGTRQKATEIVLLYAEVDQPDRIIVKQKKKKRQ